MSQSLAKNILHLIFSTKKREPLLPAPIRPDLHSYHEKLRFQDEFRTFLKRYEIEYDERYVWD